MLNCIGLKIMKYFLVIDQGTSSTRAILFDENFCLVEVSQTEFKQFFPKDGWVEHDAYSIWKDVKKLIEDILTKNNIDSSQILSIGISNQRETTVLWDKTNGIPVNKAIVWQDRRTIDICKKLRDQKLEKKVQKITGLIIVK